MTTKTITLRADLIERLEALAQSEERSLDDVFTDLLDRYTSNWALAVAQGMEAANIDWLDDPDASQHSRAHFEQHAFEKWQRTQGDDDSRTD